MHIWHAYLKSEVSSSMNNRHSEAQNIKSVAENLSHQAAVAMSAKS